MRDCPALCFVHLMAQLHIRVQIALHQARTLMPIYDCVPLLKLLQLDAAAVCVQGAHADARWWLLVSQQQGEQVVLAIGAGVCDE